MWSLMAVTLVLAAAEALVPGRLDKITDLGWSIHEDTVHWPNNKAFVYTNKIAEEKPDGKWYASNDYCSGEHLGTHLDAPYHFNKFGWKVGDIPLEKLIGKGICVNLQESSGAGTTLQPGHIDNWERRNGKIPKGSIVLINFGWGARHYEHESYMGLVNGTLHFPGVSASAAQMLVDRHITGIGVDTASIDPGTSTDFKAHRILLQANIYNMENLKIPLWMPEKGFNLVVMPINLRDGTGAPLRIFAVPNSENVGLPTPEALKDVVVSDCTPWYAHTWLVLLSLLVTVMYAVHGFSIY
ncbi:PREDICTED: kynurenine formamidase-like [Nicrophorus vespilloides]|uniref:Kynurenine formamidase-like n=1 Tax=Nicrophorus vespilloides TaxID=110193 RepID=A0ABM1NDR8_NICVS|nr:PREDICTED: kynurenine formamidase-like [Nicrophorus vespilloides]